MIPNRVEVFPGSQIDAYIIEKTLGEGGFGSVFLARKNSSRYALKLLRLWETDGPERNNILARFELEFQTGKIDSPYLVHNYEYGTLSGNPYIIMDFCPNGDLRNHMENRTLSQTKVPEIGVSILLGLDALHNNGKVHRDLKPENILFDETNKAKLSDFGIAGHANLKRLTQMNWAGKPQVVFGTYMYMPPEQAQPKSAHVTIIPTVDIFAFGVMMYELFTGSLPFGKLETQADLGTYVMNSAKGNFRDLKMVNPNIPATWAHTISHCLQPDYRKRPQNIKAVLEMVDGKGDLAAGVNESSDSTPFINLMVMQGEEFRRVYNLQGLLRGEQIGSFTIGRNDKGVVNDIDIRDEVLTYVSRRHATIEKIEKYPWWIIKDGQWNMETRSWIPSTNGTYVNSQKAETFPGKPLKPGDIITIGDTTLKVIKAD